MGISKVLIVDTDQLFLEFLEDLLSKTGLQVFLAKDGKRALELLALDPPDVLIIDLAMTEISGEQLIKYIRAEPNLRNMHIVVLSEALQEYSELGNLDVDYCLNKKDLIKTRKEVLGLFTKMQDEKKRPLRPEIDVANFLPRKIVKELLIDRYKRKEILNYLKEGLIIYDIEHHIIEVNSAACDILEKSANDLLNESLESHFEKVYKGSISHIIEEIIAGKRYEGVLKILSGYKNLALHFSNLTEQGRPLQQEGVLFVQDITPQNLAVETLDQGKNYYSGIIDSINAGILVLNRDMTIQSVNQFFQNFFNKDTSHMTGQKCHTTFYGKDIPCSNCFLDQTEIFKNGKDFSVKCSLTNLEGELCHFRVSGTPLEMQDEIISSVLLTYNDITRIERLNYYLKATTSVTSLLLEGENTREQIGEVLKIMGSAAGASRCYWFENYKDPSDRILMSTRAEWCAEGIEPQNAKFQNLFYHGSAPTWYGQLSSGGIISGSAADFSAEEGAILETQNIQSILAIPLFMRQVFVGFIGFDNCVSEYPWQETEINLLRSATDSISKTLEHKQSDKELKKSETRYREIYESVYDMWCLHDMNGRFLEVNPAGEKTAGYNERELLSMTIKDLMPDRYKDQFDDYLKELKKNGSAEGLMRIVTRNGEEKILEYNNWLVEHPERKVIARGLVRDVTDRIKLKIQLRHAQKMESMGTIASGISHNFRNILEGIMAPCQILQLNYQDNLEIQKHANEVFRLTKMGSDFITDLLHFSRKESGETKTIIDLSEILRQTFHIITQSFNKKIDIQTDLPELLPIQGNHSALSQVFMNLCINARDAMPGGGTLSIVAKKTENEIIVTITDTGCGIEGQIIDKIFEPFFTTKGFSEGTGLGLSTAYGIIKSHGGDIRVQSQPDRGTTFTIQLPLPDTATHEPKKVVGAIVPGSGQKVLIVDDDKTFLQSMEELVLGLGYRTKTAPNGRKAVEVYRVWNPNMILLDRNMSEMDGLSILKEILSIDSYARIILISGYEKEGPDGIDERTLKSINGYLTKPFDIEELSRVMAGALDK